MCGRFALNETPLKLAEFFQLSGNLDLFPSWNIAPSTNIYSITADDEGSRHLQLMKWGLIPSWAKDATIGNKLANARGETIAEKPSFRTAFKYHRCILPASGFYEWKGERGSKQPWYISLKSGNPMAFAGLWERWHAKDGEPIDGCCIITTDANDLMKNIHDRMPVILDQCQWSSWLSPHEHQAKNLLPMIHPCEPDLLQAWPVTRELNRVGLRNDAGLIEPISSES
jgi:putative SOS response-associated peptidase YedK